MPNLGQCRSAVVLGTEVQRVFGVGAFWRAKRVCAERLSGGL